MKTAFEPIANKDSRILILGTMPGEQSLQKQQYYGHGGNQFWKIMYEIFEAPFKMNYEDRKKLLLDKNIALWDVLSHCERDGSSDNNIRNEVPNDFTTFYRNHPQIRHVFFASQKAKGYYEKHIGFHKDFTFHLLPSPSPANTWKTFNEKLAEWSAITRVLNT